jgi:hypothetical protein
MIHHALDQRGVSPQHADQPWRDEIVRLHFEITGERLDFGRSKVTKVRQPDGTRKSVRVQDGSLGQADIARWPHACGIDPGGFEAYARQVLGQASAAMTMTGTPASPACFVMFAVPRPPGNATTRSGLPSSSIRLLRIGPAARPCFAQSAG